MARTISNVNVLTKVLAPIVLLTLVSMAIVWIAKDGLDSFNDLTDVIIVENTGRLTNSLDLTTAMNAAALDERNAILAKEKADIEAFAAKFATDAAQVTNSIDQLEALAGNTSRRGLLEQAKVAVQDYFTVTKRVLELAEKNQDEEAFALSSGDAEKARAKAVSLMNELVKLEKGDLEKARTNTDVLASHTTNMLVMLSGIGLLVAGAFSGWMAVYQIARPLASAAGLMSQLAGGNLGITVVGVERKDEVGTLSRSLQVFKENAIKTRGLEEAQRTQQADKERRQKVVEGYIASFDDSVRETLGTLGSAANEMRATAESMAATAEETSRQASTVAAASEQTSANVQTVAASSEEMSSSVAEIGRQVSAASKISHEAVLEAQRTNGNVNTLAEAAQKIGQVVQLIQDIASQTNLLALNATIEAARAGDAGKGFAVVASEVKSLANQTAKATEDIAGQIAAIQDATTGAVAAIQGIGGTIEQISRISTAIASAIEEQGAATQEIARNTQEAARGTEQVSATISGVNQAASETGTAATQVLASAEQLGRQSEIIRRDVGTFLDKIRAA
jgi:methyl-accepting chemotaxis protein